MFGHLLKMMKGITLFLFCISLLSLSSCGHIYTKKDTYARPEGVVVNGAQVTSAVEPQGDSGSMSFSAMVYMVGGASLKGPFKWRIEAEGKDGVHERLTVHRLKVLTEETKREEWFPADRLGSVTFKPVPDEADVVFAAYELPGTLEVYPEKDGAFKVIVDVSVKTKSRTQRKLVKFHMARSKESGTEFLFLPTEIAKGWKKSPRDWQW